MERLNRILGIIIAFALAGVVIMVALPLLIAVICVALVMALFGGARLYFNASRAPRRIRRTRPVYNATPPRQSRPAGADETEDIIDAEFITLDAKPPNNDRNRSLPNGRD